MKIPACHAKVINYRDDDSRKCSKQKFLSELEGALSMNAKHFCIGAGVALVVGAGSNALGAGTIEVDGSSTVYPITEAVAEEFQKVGGARVTVGISGTGGGFKRFCRGETDISDASRPILKD